MARKAQSSETTNTLDELGLEQELQLQQEIEAANTAMTVAPQQVAVSKAQQEAEYRDLLRRTVCKGLDDGEMDYFLAYAKKTGLDPISHQIYAVKRYDSRQRREVMTVQTGIDGYRSIAQNTGKYRGQLGPWYCGKDGQFREVWIPSEGEPVFPYAAKVSVLHADFDEPLTEVALWGEYAQTNSEGFLTGLWSKMATNQLAKCAEAKALRKAFPAELGSLYTTEEMAQADRTQVAETQQLTAPPVDDDEKPRKRKSTGATRTNELQQQVTQLAQQPPTEYVNADYVEAAHSGSTPPVPASEPEPAWYGMTKGKSTEEGRVAFAEANRSLGIASRVELLALIGYENWNEIPSDITFGELYKVAKEKKDAE